MFWGFHGLWLLLPLLLLGKFFWILLLALLIGALVRGFGRRNRWMAYYGRTPFYNPGTPPTPDSNVVERKNQNETIIDAVTDKVVARIALGVDGQWGDDVGHVAHFGLNLGRHLGQDLAPLGRRCELMGLQQQVTKVTSK